MSRLLLFFTITHISNLPDLPKLECSVGAVRGVSLTLKKKKRKVLRRSRTSYQITIPATRGTDFLSTVNSYLCFFLHHCTFGVTASTSVSRSHIQSQHQVLESLQNSDL